MDGKKEEIEFHTNNGHLFAVNSMAHNCTQYTNNGYLCAIHAQALQIKIGHLGTRDYFHLLNSNALLNCPVTPKDVQAAEQIFGPDIGALKGKTTHQNPPIVDSPISGTSIIAQLIPRDYTLC